MISRIIKKLHTTPCIINGWFSPTYENPRGFSIQFLFAIFSAETTPLIIHNNVASNCRNEEQNILHTDINLFRSLPN